MSDLVEDVVDIQTDENGNEVISLTDFIRDFGPDLMRAVKEQNPPVYQGEINPKWHSIMDRFARKPFQAQADAVQAICKLLIDKNEPASILNAEMGTGKTMMGIAAAAILHEEGYKRTLVLSPPHLVYKWRREIKKTIPDATVWILNGPDTLRKLLQLRLVSEKPVKPEFYILGRVRMRMGFQWKPAFTVRTIIDYDSNDGMSFGRYACCPHCGTPVKDEDGNLLPPIPAEVHLNHSRQQCVKCNDQLWTLVRDGSGVKSMHDLVTDAMMQIPTIGEKRAEKLIGRFGEDMLSGMLSDNVYEFINLMDGESGDFVFNDNQARRIERYLSNTEVSFGQGGYQPTEFIKRYLPQNFFGTLLVDEGHEYKNEGSAQGQAMGVLARKCNKIVLLTGTLMGGYADDLFYLLFRLKPEMMMEDGFGYNARNSLGPGAMAFMREHGILIDVMKEIKAESHRTARGTKYATSTKKGPGFGPVGIMRYILPYTVFLKLKDIGGNVLPPYDERFRGVSLSAEQESTYHAMESVLKAELRDALRNGDHSLLGVVLNTLLAWPDCAFRDEVARHPRTKRLLYHALPAFDEHMLSPKEQDLREYCMQQKMAGRRVLIYAIYTGTRDITARLKRMLEVVGLKISVLKASVPAEKREDWLMDQVDRGVDCIITNPELVKTGLDMLEFPSIYFLQTGYNVYTLMQAARRSWRIGQNDNVEVVFSGYEGTAQMQCLELMSKKIAVCMSTSGDMPESGLDILNQSGDSIEVALAKELLAA